MLLKVNDFLLIWIDNNMVCEKIGSEGNELLDFIIDTLSRTAKDRALFLRIEADLITFIKDRVSDFRMLIRLLNFRWIFLFGLTQIF